MQPLIGHQPLRGIASSKRRTFANIPGEVLDHARAIALPLVKIFAGEPSYILGVTSTLPGEGKSTISTSLAEVITTDFGITSMLVDAHAERPWTTTEETLSGHLGLGEWLAGDATLTDATVFVHEKWSMLPFGTQPMSSRDVLQSIVRAGVLQQLRDQYPVIVLDLPDMLNPAAAALANLCDGLMLVVKAGETPIDKVREVLTLLQTVTIHGVVLNRHRSAIPAVIRHTFK